jgi:hypothetical protein
MVRKPFPLTLAGPVRRRIAGAARQIAVTALLSLVVVAGLSAQATTSDAPHEPGAAQVEAPAAQSAILIAAAAP